MLPNLLMEPNPRSGPLSPDISYGDAKIGEFCEFPEDFREFSGSVILTVCLAFRGSIAESARRTLSGAGRGGFNANEVEFTSVE